VGAIQCVTSAFGDRPRRMMIVIKRFGKHCSCHLQIECVEQWFPNGVSRHPGVSGGTTRCVAKLKKIFKLRLMMIINN
jgi:hypothetical protein